MNKYALDILPRELDSWVSKDGSWRFFIKHRPTQGAGQSPMIYIDLIKNAPPFYCVDIIDLIAQGTGGSKISMVNDVHIQLTDKFYFHDHDDKMFGVQVFVTSILMILTLSLSYLTAKDPLRDEITILKNALSDYYELVTKP